MMTRVCCESLPCTISSGTEAVEVGRTGMMLNVLAPVAVHVVPAVLPLHVCAGSTTETVTVPEVARSLALRRSRAPVEGGAVVVPEVEEAGRGNRILICPEVESFTTGVGLLGYVR